MIRIEEYLDEDNESPFGQWFAALDPQAAAIVTVALGRPGDGNTSSVKSIGEGAAELRIDAAQVIGSISAGTARCW